MRSVSKNKLFLCFRPVVDIDVVLDSTVAVHRSTGCRFPCDPVADKDGFNNSETKSSFSDKGYHEISENSMPPKRKLSRVIKAMVCETILNRRARRKNRYSQDSCGSSRSYSTYTETSSTGDDKSICSQLSMESYNIQEINTETSSPESKYLIKSESYPPQEKQRKRSRRDPLEKKKRKTLECYGIYLVLLSLTLTVFWGKILGIVLTSVWLYSYPIMKARYLMLKTESKVHRNRSHKGRCARKEVP